MGAQICALPVLSEIFTRFRGGVCCMAIRFSHTRVSCWAKTLK